MERMDAEHRRQTAVVVGVNLERGAIAAPRKTVGAIGWTTFTSPRLTTPRVRMVRVVNMGHRRATVSNL